MSAASDAIRCAGVPREQGFAQGRASREALHERCASRGALVRAQDALGLLEPASARWLRDLRRQFPHQGEWLEGAARGAGLALPALVRAARASHGAAPRALVACEVDGGARIGRALPPHTIVRRMEPEGCFRTLELALPWLSAPWLGVNEAGLAVAATSGARADARCAAPGALFARDCLERFESVGSALAWCLGRPAAPGASLLFADASGEIAGIELAPTDRRVRRPERGVLVLGADAAGAAAIEKRLAEGSRDALAFGQALGAQTGECASADPAGRRLLLGEREIAL
ncbi:MAG TPA: carcinine hydrolase/isopenicillin-N N-acyltransferase family protein [Myxococcota bacterium]|nr:carcinine hydrolase/isopenicillin-N N-acyltransferase family protein [Myxococcota bacterium]